MGWLFTLGSTRRDLIAERTAAWETTGADGMLVRSTCIAHCYRGCPWSGVLWSVWERTFTKGGVEARPTERWIGCDLLQFSKRDDGWGYKDQEEAMHPYTYLLPLVLPRHGAGCLRGMAGRGPSIPPPAAGAAAGTSGGTVGVTAHVSLYAGQR